MCCGTVSQGSPQFIVVEFPGPVSPSELHIQFHGGFSGQSCLLEAQSDDGSWNDVMKFYPRDCSSLQVCIITTAAKYATVHVAVVLPIVYH